MFSLQPFNTSGVSLDFIKIIIIAVIVATHH